MKDLILAILKSVPEPHVRAVATTIEAIVTLVRHNPAAVTEASVREMIDEAVAEALEPWARIKARAAVETGAGVQDAGGFVVGRED